MKPTANRQEYYQMYTQKAAESLTILVLKTAGVSVKVYGIGFLVELVGLVRYYMQIKGNFDLSDFYVKLPYLQL